jgi:AcrR family transcriptional regulator
MRLCYFIIPPTVCQTGAICYLSNLGSLTGNPKTQNLDSVKISVYNLDSVKIDQEKTIMSPHKYHHGDLKNALIQAGIGILSEEGIHALSLRKVAQRAGVSHAAPYAHFTDKQALIAAISTEGYRQLFDYLASAVKQHHREPSRQLVEAAWAYVQFALREPAHFKITLSGVVEKEQDYPALVEMIHRAFGLLIEVTEACQQAGILKPGPSDQVAVSVWSMVHGFTSLVLEGQIASAWKDRLTLREMLIFSLDQITLVSLEARSFPAS